MKIRKLKILPIIVFWAAISLSCFSFAGGSDDPVLTMLKIDQLEMRYDDDHKPVILEGEMWIGRDLDKLWMTVDAESVNEHVEEAEVELLYGRAIAPFWDARVGIRQSIRPDADTWGVIGVKGLAPYMFDVDASLAVNDDAQTHLNVTAEYDAMITQRLYLSPGLTVNAYSKNDVEKGVGSGLSSASIGLRLGYEIRREFSPYIGVNVAHKFGKTKELAQSSGEDASEVQLLIGVSAWR